MLAGIGLFVIVVISNKNRNTVSNKSSTTVHAVKTYHIAFMKLLLDKSVTKRVLPITDCKNVYVSHEILSQVAIL